MIEGHKIIQAEDKEAANVMRTALEIATLRAKTDVPFVGYILQQLVKKFKSFKKTIEDRDYENDHDKYFITQTEIRFKYINYLLEQTGYKNIFELGAGYDPRDIIYALKGFKTVELDLPGVIEKKNEIIRGIIKGAKDNDNDIISNLKNLKIEDFKKVAELLEKINLIEGDARNSKIYKKVETILDETQGDLFYEDQLVVISEGLLRYFNLKDKEKIVQNVKSILGKYGGVWITSDTCTLENFHYVDDEIKFKEDIDKFNKHYGLTEKDNFKNMDAVKEFFINNGFDITIHHLKEKKEELDNLEIKPSLKDERLAEKVYANTYILELKLSNLSKT